MDNEDYNTKLKTYQLKKPKIKKGSSITVRLVKECDKDFEFIYLGKT